MRERKGDKRRFRVLFLCTGNSCRSQMAEGWTRSLLGNRVEAFSAGTRPSRVDPRAVQVMREVGIDISAHCSKSVDTFADEPFDLVITLCDEARAECPLFPGARKTVHIGFPDPARAVGSESEVLEVFREIRDRIRGELIPIVEQEILSSETG